MYTYIKMLMMEWLLSYEMDLAIWVQILNEAVCISNNSNIFGKGMNPTILPPAMSK